MPRVLRQQNRTVAVLPISHYTTMLVKNKLKLSSHVEIDSVSLHLILSACLRLQEKTATVDELWDGKVFETSP